ncbi:MAG TPA: response regulator [bacterium]|nr:response regulator [bacterium]
MTTEHSAYRPFQVLMVEDNGGDVFLMQKALREKVLSIRVDVVTDGEDGLAYLRREGRFEDALRPDLVLLDLNLPLMDGRTLLRKVKRDPALRAIPILVFTSSSLDSDIREAYDLDANSYVMKPTDLAGFRRVAEDLSDFWFKRALLPPQES